jgi:hypothetical protein
MVPKPGAPDPLYALEKLGPAADALASGAGAVRECLFEAFKYLRRVRPEDIADENFRGDLVDVMNMLTSEQGHGNEGRLVATLRTVDTRMPASSPLAFSNRILS